MILGCKWTTALPFPETPFTPVLGTQRGWRRQADEGEGAGNVCACRLGLLELSPGTHLRHGHASQILPCTLEGSRIRRGHAILRLGTEAASSALVSESYHGVPITPSDCLSQRPQNHIVDHLGDAQRLLERQLWPRATSAALLFSGGLQSRLGESTWCPYLILKTWRADSRKPGLEIQ